MEDNANKVELERLRAIGAWMREVGVVELQTTGCMRGDIHIRLGPAPVVHAEPAHVDPDEKEELTAEQLELKNLSVQEREWLRRWRRITRSSGAPIPPFPGREKAT